jgi:hypothetical protein
LTKYFFITISFWLFGCQPETAVIQHSTVVLPAINDSLSIVADSAKMLFVGNSHTYVNNIPLLVQQMGAAENRAIEVEDISLGNYAIIDHINDGKVQNILKTKKYNMVVSQQGPSSLPASLVVLTEGAVALAAECKKTNAKLYLYAIWPDKSRWQFIDDVIANYTTAAHTVGAGVCAAGTAWKLAHSKNPNITLYSPDLSHASPQGSLLSAMTIYATVFKKANLDFLEYNNSPFAHLASRADFELFKEVITSLALDK